MAVKLFGALSPSPAESQDTLEAFQAGDFASALGKAKSLTQRFPQHPLGWRIAGAVLRARQQHEEALPYLRKAAELAPRDAAIQFNLANALRDLFYPEEAAQYYRRALKIRADLPHGFFHLANMQHEAGQHSLAEKSFRRALELEPTHVETMSNLAHLLHDMGRPEEALTLYDSALALSPSHPGLHYNRADVLVDLGQLEEAEASVRRVLEREPQMAEAHAKLAEIRLAQDDPAAAVACYKQALTLAPTRLELYSSLLMVSSYLPTVSPRETLDCARAFGAVCAKEAGETRPLPARALAQRRLRVGLVSGDLRQHPVGHFLEAVLKEIDRNRIELIAISTQQFEDDLTQRIRPYFHEWICVAAAPDLRALETIRLLRLDVAIDLSGHTAGNRLSLFAHRVAAVQTSWLGYFATTGLAEMDYLIADPVTVPPEIEWQFTERIWRLPETRLCFTAPEPSDPVQPLPALSGQPLTLGCLSNLLKVNDGVIALWTRVLNAIPDSKLLVQAKQLKDPVAAARLRDRFARQGITADRLIIEPPQSRQDYLRTYHRVDFCLDPFPYPGGTTTAESLWMGVPVLTLEGSTLLSRQGAGLLHAAGLRDWVAQTPEDYVSKAAAFARDLPGLSQLRSELRQQVQQSPLFNASRFARHLEAAIEGMWQTRTS
ncbi:tetratricopeptide repeat protein [Acidovorax lacteus]|uniref:protein O-GlcNAc transferase n=1 Tax=Acidovorax lacteus TaxID=1924988 RepID=A0ABP8LGI2_9BURK